MLPEAHQIIIRSGRDGCTLSWMADMTGTHMTSEDEELRALLSKDLPEIPFRFFYDDQGMQLFGRITELPEYYQTRTETKILKERGLDIMGAGPFSSICELGAGDAVKIRHLIDAGLKLGRMQLVALVDVNREAVDRSCALLAADYPALDFTGYVADLTKDLSFLGRGSDQLVAYLGGSFGNFGPSARGPFLTRLAQSMGAQDTLLLGVDLVKDAARLEAAYDDAQGVTAQFNLNALRHMNRETGSNFVIEAFEHVARYDEENQWVELSLRAVEACEVQVPSVGVELSFQVGDRMRTELSCKYTRQSLQALADKAGFDVLEWITDDEQLFGLAVLRPALA